MGIIAFMGNVGIFIYLAFWLPYIMVRARCPLRMLWVLLAVESAGGMFRQHVEEEWEDYCPRVIPTATLIGLFSTLWCAVALPDQAEAGWRTRSLKGVAAAVS